MMKPISQVTLDGAASDFTVPGEATNLRCVISVIIIFISIAITIIIMITLIKSKK